MLEHGEAFYEGVREIGLEGMLAKRAASSYQAGRSRDWLKFRLEKSFDFVGDFSGKLPMDVMSDMIGVPPSDRQEIRRLADLLVHREEGVFDVPPAGAEAAFTLARYFADMVTERRKARRDDLTSALCDAELDGERLTDNDIMSFLFLMVVAGNETTAKLLANAWYWGRRNPAELAKPFEDERLISPWIEENGSMNFAILSAHHLPLRIKGSTHTKRKVSAQEFLINKR